MFACIHVPDFLVQAAMRNERGDLRKQPVAILEGPEALLKVTAVNDAARREGIEVGLSRPQAEICPNILLRKRSQEQENAAQAALLDCASWCSPRVESTLPGTVIADIHGTERLLGSLQDIGSKLSARTGECGFSANVGIAANPDTALYAARGFTGISVIAAGEEAQKLAALPVEILEPSAKILDVLDSWGIGNLGAFATLPPIALVQRLGQEGLALQRLAKGEARRELVPAEAPLSFQESMELEEPVELLEPLAFILNRLLEQITSRLQARTLATDVVHTVLELEIRPDLEVQGDRPKSQIELCTREMKLPVPTEDAKLLLKLLQLDLEAHPPHAPIKKVTITAEPARLRPTQAGLFVPLAPEPGKLEVAVARLRGLVGDVDSSGRPRVGTPAVTDSNCPDDFAVVPFKSLQREPLRHCLPSPTLALRIFRPPLPAAVQMKDEVPVAVAFNGYKARVLTAAGPWRSSGAWWVQQNEWQREEWEVALDGNTASGLFRLFRDTLSGRWFVEGMYD